MMPITLRSWVSKLILVYAKVMLAFLVSSNYANIPFDAIVKEATIHKFSLYIFYGMLALLVDNGGIRLFFSEPFYVRYTTKTKWLAKLFLYLAKQQAVTVLLAGVFVYLNALLFGFPIAFTFTIASYFFSFWLYLMTLNLLVTAVLCLVGKHQVAFAAGMCFNIACLVLGHLDILQMDQAGSMVVFLLLFLLLGILIACKSRTLELFRNRDVRVSNGV